MTLNSVSGRFCVISRSPKAVCECDARYLYSSSSVLYSKCMRRSFTIGMMQKL